MAHPRQSTIRARMESETRKAQRALEDSYSDKIERAWKTTKRNMESSIASEYRQDFGRGPWDVTGAVRSGTLERIGYMIGAEASAFNSYMSSLVREGRAAMHKGEIARQLWMLDQQMPPSKTPIAPTASLREADISGPGWETALDNWLIAYRDSLMTNLRLEALHESSMSDAIDEVDATRIGGFQPEDKFLPLWHMEALTASQSARNAVAKENDVQEVWLTMEDGRVCPICDGYDGKPLSQIGDEPPAHWRCRCYSSIVPAKWAAMLASGDPAEKQAALDAEDRGLVPDAMVIRDESGDLVGAVTVQFSNWKKNAMPYIMGGL